MPMHLHKLATVIISAAVFFSASAQKLTRNESVVPDAYNFWLYTPKDAVKTPKGPVSVPADTVKTEKSDFAQNDTVFSKGFIPDSIAADSVVTPAKKPVFIFLHGASLCGRNLDKVRRYGTIDAIERGRDIDGYVIAPQNPGGAWNPRRVINILDWLEKEYANVDHERVYVLGMSLGGYGTIDMAASYPDRIAAAIAMCGGATVKDLSELNELPLWIIHGTSDNRVSVRESDRVVNEMKAAFGGNEAPPRLSYDRVKGMNHSKPARVFYMPETYDWLMGHSLDEENRPLHETFDVSEAHLTKAFKGLHYPKPGSRATKSRATKKRSRATRKSSTAKKSGTAQKSTSKSTSKK